MDIASRERLVEQAARRFEADIVQTRQAFDRAERSMGQEIRLCRRGDRMSRSSCSVRFVAGGQAGAGFLVHCFKTGEGGFFRLSGHSAAPDARCHPSATGRQDQPLAGSAPDRAVKAALARTIASQGTLPGAGIRRTAPDYAVVKGLTGFRLQAAPDKSVPPCPAIRWAARDYALGGHRLLRAGTPFWALRDCHSDEVRGVQFKFWSWRAAAWCTRTIGSQFHAWIDLLPEDLAAGSGAAVVLAEGISTAWAVHCLLAGRHRVIATLGIAGLRPCAQAAARRFPDQGIAIVADLDRNRQGEHAARRAASAVGGSVYLPHLLQDDPAAVAQARARGLDAWDLWARLGGRALEGGLAALWPAAID